MLLQQLNRTDAEKVFVIGQNVSTGTTVGNTLVCWESIVATASLGNAFNKPATSNLNLFAGVIDADAATDAYQLVQVYGFRASIAGVVGTAVSVSAAGQIVGPVAGQASFHSNGQSFVFGPILVMDNATSGVGYWRGFIRAL